MRRRLRAASAFASGGQWRDVEEYCVSESWTRAPAGRTHDRKDNRLLIKLIGTVDPYF